MIHIVKGNRETPIIGTPQDYINVYQDCLKQKPNERPNIDKVIDLNVGAFDECQDER
ncbi:9356_t:CDS:2 [Diversispora eburnea]|uniref:9356_t:CDS:1 n=1 Tax=Diversispora eburnea TaxID=1213867 RepID=A0A9N8V1A1_9GLOM|nr:9356_t:CDS:2 [Diversispora eburnea]